MVDQQINFLHFCTHLTYHIGHAFELNIFSNIFTGPFSCVLFIEGVVLVTSLLFVSI